MFFKLTSTKGLPEGTEASSELLNYYSNFSGHQDINTACARSQVKSADSAQKKDLKIFISPWTFVSNISFAVGWFPIDFCSEA